jgi:hypothetical protein
MGIETADRHIEKSTEVYGLNSHLSGQVNLVLYATCVLVRWLFW